MTYRPNWDALTLRAYIDNDQDELDRLALLARVSCGACCPQCGGDEIDTNANSTAFLCTGCEHQWDGADIEV